MHSTLQPVRTQQAERDKKSINVEYIVSLDKFELNFHLTFTLSSTDLLKYS